MSGPDWLGVSGPDWGGGWGCLGLTGGVGGVWA